MYSTYSTEARLDNKAQRNETIHKQIPKKKGKLFNYTHQFVIPIFFQITAIRISSCTFCTSCMLYIFHSRDIILKY